MSDTSSGSGSASGMGRQQRRALERERRKLAQRTRRHGGTAPLMPLFAFLIAPGALALPVDGKVVSGDVAIGQAANNTLPITQTSPKGIVNWKAFSIGGNETVNIRQPNASAVLLNRVTGTDASVIAGHLNANGRVFLVNPAGVLFAPGASVNVGSLVASTLGISDKDFLAGKYRFTSVGGPAGAGVVNQGTITAANGGTVAMLGAQVDNQGTVSAKLGTVALGAGSDITLDFAGDGLTMLRINGAAADALVANSGAILADGGLVVMSVQSADALAGTVLNQQGVVRAQSVAERDGRILLDGGGTGETQVAGLLDATAGAGLTGGHIDVTGYHVALQEGARVDASGAAGGGRVRFGGGAAGADADLRNAQAVWMAPDAQIHANALANGAGGQVVAFGHDTARLYGTLTAKGGPLGGNGGKIETSGDYLDIAQARIDASAPMGVGGLWLIDPVNLTITDPTTLGATPAGSSTISNAAIDAQLNNNTSVTITTVPTAGTGSDLGNIFVQGAISRTSGTTAATLTLNALNSIIMTPVPRGDGPTLIPSITAAPGTGPLGIVLQANASGNAANNGAAIQMAGEGGTAPFPNPALRALTLQSNGGDVVIGNVAATAAQTGASVPMNEVTIDTRVQTGNGADLTQPGGNLTIRGSSAGGNAVSLTGVTINTNAGAIDVRGAVNGTTLGDGVFISGSSDVRTVLSSGAGPIRVYGSGSAAPGVAITQSNSDTPARVVSTGGSIDIRGLTDGRPQSASNVDSFFPAVSLTGASIEANGALQTVSVTGSVASLQPPSTASAISMQTSTLQTGAGGTVILRGASPSTNATLAIDGSDTISTTGTLVLVPGSVAPATFAIVPGDATQIDIAGTGAGFNIPASLLNAASSSIDTIVVGSNTHTGSITLNAFENETPFFNTSLTLENTGTNSGGISLPAGLDAGFNTLTLASTGPVTQGDAIIANSLILAGAGNFLLTNANNQMSNLAMAGTGRVDYQNAGDLRIAGNVSSGFGSATNQVVQLGNAALAPIGNTTVTAQAAGESAGDIDVGGTLLKSAGGDATLSLNAARDIDFTPSSVSSTSGALNIVLDATRQITIGNTNSSSADRVQISTNGGNFTAGTATGGTTGYDSAAVFLERADIDTRAGATSGSITLHGVNNFDAEQAIGVDINSSTLTTSSGSVELQGTSVGPNAGPGSGVVVRNNVFVSFGTTPPSAITSGSGAVRLYGAGSGALEAGVGIYDGSTITTTNGGTVDIRGSAQGNEPAGSRIAEGANGVVLQDGAISANGAGSKISIAGSTTSFDPGILIAVPGSSDGEPPPASFTITTGQQGVLSLLPGSVAGVDSLDIEGAANSISIPQGVAAIAAASVDPGTFAVPPQNAVPITLFGSGTGLSISPAEYQAFSPTLQTLVLGSATQTGAITVNGACAGGATTCVAPQRPSVATSLTLLNPATGSGGIALPYGVSMPGKTLALNSAGPVTDPNGIRAAGLLLAGNTNFTLIDAGNDVGTLAISNANNVTFSNLGSFAIGPLSAQSFDWTTQSATAIGVTDSTLSGILQATSTNGSIALGATTVRAGGKIDLVMENGVFANPGNGRLVSGDAWHVWASTWQGETRGGLDPGGAQPNFYGCSFPGTCSWPGNVPLNANHFVYVARPSVRVDIGDQTRVEGAPNGPFGFTTSGLVTSDTQGNALTAGPLTSTATPASPPGRYPIDGTFSSPVGYLVTVVPGTLTITPPPERPIDPAIFNRSGLQPLFTAQEQSFVYESNLGGINICVGSTEPILALQQPESVADSLAVEWKRVRSRPNLNSCLVVNGEHGCGEF